MYLLRRARYTLAASTLAVVPLAYSVDHDPFRAYEIVGIAIIALALATLLSFRVRLRTEHLFVLAYCIVLFAQPFLLPDFSLWFGFQYAAVMVAAFIPAWVIKGIRWRPQEFEVGLEWGMRLISVVIVANVVGGRLLSFGETYQSDLTMGARSFGFLGDSISPVILFPLFYFCAQRKWIWVLALAASLLMTGGKAALVMAALAAPLFMMTRGSQFVQVTSVLAIVVVGALVYPVFDSLLAAITSDERVAYSWNTRLLSFEVGLQYFKSSPWIGIGINQSMINIRLDADDLAYIQGTTQYFNVYQIHNAYVRALAETGVLGFAVLVALSVLWLTQALQSLNFLRRLSSSGSPRLRALIVASSLWPILFIATYQTTGWFEHGHPQLAWILIINSIGMTSMRLLKLSSRGSFAPTKRQHSGTVRSRANFVDR